MRLFILIGAALSLVPTAAFAQAASPWPEADRIFHSDPLWLGSDGGFSIDLGKGRVLWSFGDTLVVKKAGDTRKMAAFVHNTVAIQTGYDPSTAQMKYYWRRWGSHMEIFPSDGKVWMWPSHGIRIGNRLVVFCSRIQNRPVKGSFAFEGVGSQAFVIENPDAAPTEWKMRAVMKDDTKVMVGSAVMQQGDYIYVYCESENVPLHDIFLARWKAVDFAAASFDGMEWWNGGGWSARANREPVMRAVSSELSVQANPRGGFVEVNSQGWGASDIVMRTAPKLEGPWSEAKKIYHPPEGDRPHVLTYAGKAHPELRGADLILTYGINGSDEADGNGDTSLYFPRFARMNWPNRVAQ
jgi:hypothetical protein